MNAQERDRTEEEHRDFLDEIYGTVQICGMTFDSGRALQLLDPTAFRCSSADMPTEYVCAECDTNHGEDETLAEDCCKEECPTCGELCDNDGSAESHCPEEEEEEEKEKANDRETKLR